MQTLDRGMWTMDKRMGWDSNPRETSSVGLVNRCLRPLGHPSKRNGQGGIRTHDTVTRIQHFQCCSFNHSDTCPPCNCT
jgi:hypothetical protein